ncbi:MAG: PhoH family protein, partial [Ramlibacter sp.]
MPLPPAPNKRAALLPAEAYDAPARSSHKAARKTEAPGAEPAHADKPQAADDLDPRAYTPPVHPVAFREEEPAAERPSSRRRASTVAANEPAAR